MRYVVMLSGPAPRDEPWKPREFDNEKAAQATGTALVRQLRGWGIDVWIEVYAADRLIDIIPIASRPH
ncbi:MAG TPA: hypothetical protein VGL04_05240 [Sporichthyaceae bacterium]|jgi:hypothetical protein